MRALGHPRLHLRLTDSTNTRARELAGAGAPHGMLVTALEQQAGRGRQGRIWTAPPGRALLCSLVVREPPRLLPLLAGVAVADAIERVLAGTCSSSPPGRGDARPQRTGEGTAAGRVQLKWPNDVHLNGLKVSGILVEGRPQERWAVVGVGVNVALAATDFPPELRETATTLGLEPAAIEPMLDALLDALHGWLTAAPAQVLAAVRRRDALAGRQIRWAQGEGRAEGIDEEGRLIVLAAGGDRVALDAGEVHLSVAPPH